VLDGSRCNATTTSGCQPAAATIPVGLGPQGLVVDSDTHTLYVANQAFNDLPGTLSVIDTARCNGSTSSACSRSRPTIATALGPRALALDTARHTLYTANSGDATASIVRGGAEDVRVAVGDVPTDIAFDSTTGTVYVAASFAPPPATSVRGIVSVFKGQ
jgi:DNA-binding beta-propeller fold protein YncE